MNRHERSSVAVLACAIGVVVGVATVPCAAQCPGAWLYGNGLPGVTPAQVFASTVWDPDGAGPGRPLLVVGGTFSVAGEAVAPSIAAWDGETWRALGGGLNNPARTLTTYNGDLIAGGSFTMADSAPASRIARWDGTEWHALGSGLNNSATAMTVYNGDLVVAGTFTTAGGIAANHIARWDGAAWHAMGSLGSTVYSLTVYNGQLLAGGTFSTHAAVWDGAAWTDYPINPNCFVFSFAELDGDLYIAGNTSVVVKRLHDGAWQQIGSGGSGIQHATLAVWRGELYLTQCSMSASGIGVNDVARWTGAGWANHDGFTNGDDFDQFTQAFDAGC